jgi:murein L,D-transpeptidase YcbB/YkuD
MSLYGQINALSPEITRMVIATIDRMESQVAARFIKYHRWRFRGTPGFPDLVVKLLADPNTYDGDLQELAEELAEASLEDIRRLGQAIRDAGAACARRGVDLTDDLLDVLTAAGVWSEAAAVAQAATDRLEDTRWNRPRKLHAKARQAAAELELAAANGQTAQILAVSTKWRELLQEIQRDYEENEAARSPLRGIRLPRPSE